MQQAGRVGLILLPRLRPNELITTSPSPSLQGSAGNVKIRGEGERGLASETPIAVCEMLFYCNAATVLTRVSHE